MGRNMTGQMLKTAVGRLRAIGLFEGTSFLVLLCIAMPLKYAAGMPMAVKIVGWLHGVLFVMYLVALTVAHSTVDWSAGRTLLVFLASLVPGGPFMLDGWMRRQEQLARK
jgi:integral membrane protein